MTLLVNAPFPIDGGTIDFAAIVEDDDWVSNILFFIIFYPFIGVIRDFIGVQLFLLALVLLLWIELSICPLYFPKISILDCRGLDF